MVLLQQPGYQVALGSVHFSKNKLGTTVSIQPWGLIQESLQITLPKSIYLRTRVQRYFPGIFIGKIHSIHSI